MVSLSSQCRIELESAIEHSDKELSEICRTELKAFVTKNNELKNDNNNKNGINSNNGRDKDASSSSSSKPKGGVISNLINGWEFEITGGMVILLILLLYFFIAKNNKSSHRISKTKFRTPPRKPGKEKEKR